MPLTRIARTTVSLLVGIAAFAAQPVLPVLAQEKAEQTAPERPAPAIRVVAATPRELVVSLAVNGTVVPREEAAVGVDLNGLTVLSLDADIGDRVKKGDVLAVLDRSALDLALVQAEAQRAQIDAQVAQAQAQIADAKVGVRQAGEQLERLEALRKKGVASQAQYDNAVNAADSARAKQVTAEKAVAAAQAQAGVNAAQIRELQRQIARTEVKAPADGLVLSRSAMLGAVVGASAGPLFRIAVNGELELQATVAETHLPGLAEGQSVMVSVPGQGKPVKGAVRLIAPEVNKTTRLGTLYITLPADAPLRTGNFASATVELVRKQALAIPAVAVLFRDGKPYVQKVVDGVVRSTPVKLGVRAAAFVEVADGIAQGDQIVSRAGVFVSDGDRIAPVLEEATGAVAR